MGALSRAFADDMRTLHVFGFCVALPFCAERNLFEGAVADGMRTLHMLPACALPASCMLVACANRLYVGGSCTSWEVSAHRELWWGVNGSGIADLLW